MAVRGATPTEACGLFDNPITRTIEPRRSAGDLHHGGAAGMKNDHYEEARTLLARVAGLLYDRRLTELVGWQHEPALRGRHGDDPDQGLGEHRLAP